MTDVVVVSELTGFQGLSDPIALYRDVFALRPTDPAPSPRLLAALAQNGGIALGAYSGGELVGFCYGFLGKNLADESAPYHYLELIVVRADRRNTGIGRLLMYRLREVCLDHGLHTIHWAYDPLRVDNAHFYLDVLGARGCQYIPNLYGTETTGRDRGHRTDRVIAHWNLTASRQDWPQPPAGVCPGVPTIDTETDTVLLAMPTGECSPGLQAQICVTLKDLITSGFQIVSCRTSADNLTVYRLVADTLRRDPHRHDVPPRSGPS
ncbi:GNAT family N-acetyltransferase [Nocardia sp. JMUB6875]|uniref:GNAT family N-acetyltransferase n=1 Tax=Nocardia sp. JMUB6875 TaxID=3158170 RepID=UPI0034E8F637